MDFEAAKERARAITPVPGGVGPMTRAMLLVNTLKAARARGACSPVRSRRMDLRRLRAGEWIAGDRGPCAAGLAVPALVRATTPARRTGWEAFGALDVVLALVALSALAILVVTAIQRAPAVPLALQALTALVGRLAVVLVLIRVLNMPDWRGRARVGPVGRRSPRRSGSSPAALVAMRDERLSRGAATPTSPASRWLSRSRSRRSRRRAPRPSR